MQKQMRSLLLLCGALVGWIQGGSAQSLTIDPLPQLKAYDLKFARLEVKLSEEVSRIAGQQELHLEVLQPFSQFWIELGAHIRVARVLVDGENCRFDRQKQFVQVYLPEPFRQGETHKVTLFYGGDLLDRFSYPVWESTDGKIQIALDESRLYPSDWFPAKTLVSDPLDSLHIQVIFPFGTDVAATGSRRWRFREPGEFIKHAFRAQGPIYPDDVFIFAGNVERFTDQYQGKNGLYTLTYVIQPGQLSQAKQHLNQIKRIFRSLEAQIGPDPLWESGYTWYQPLPETYTDQDLSLPDPQMVTDVSQRWLPDRWFAEDTLEQWFRRAFTAYAAGLVVEDWAGAEAAEAWLLDSSDHFVPEAAILHTLRGVVDNDERWFDALAGCLNPNPSFASMPEYLSGKLGEDLSKLFVYYLTVESPPVLTYRYIGKGKKTSLQYRWSAAPSGFTMPVVALFGGDRFILYPTTRWQEISVKGANRKDFSLDQGRGWFILQRDPADVPLDP